MWKYKDIPDFIKNQKHVLLTDIDEKYVLLEDGRVWSRATNRFLQQARPGMYSFRITKKNRLTTFCKAALLRKYFTNIDELITEEYREVYDNSNYLITKDGQVYSKLKNKFLKPVLVQKSGWLIVSLMYGQNRKSVYIATALWEAFNGPITKYYKLIFKDGNKQNVHLDNLDVVLKNGYRYIGDKK